MPPLMSSRAIGAHSLVTSFATTKTRGLPRPLANGAIPIPMQMVVFYKDLNKVARDILTDDYSLKRTLKMKHTTPHGLSVTSKSEHNKGVAAALEAKYFHTPSGVMIDKAKLNPDGSMGVEASMKGVAKDVKILAKVNDVLKGDVSVEVTKPKMSTTATVNVEGTWVKASSCVAVGNSLLVGADVESTLGGEKQPSLKAYSVGAATGGPRWGASVTCTNKLQTYNASGYYIVQPDMIASVLASTTPEKSEHSFQGGVKYKFKPDTTVRAKINSKGVAAACVVQQCASKLSVTVTGQVSKADTKPKFGVTCALG